MLLGLSGIFGKLVDLNEGLITWYRIVFSAILLFVLLKWKGINLTMSWKELWKMGKPGLAMAASWLLFFASIKYSNVSIAVVCYCAVSFFTAILAPLINKKRIRWSELALSMLTIIGISLIFKFDVSYRFGIVLGVLAPVFAATYTIYNERLVKHYNSRVLTFYQMILGALALVIVLPVYFLQYDSIQWIPTLWDVVNLVLLALLCTVVAYVLLSEALKKISAFTVNLTLNLEPLYAIAIAFVFFGEAEELNIGFYLGLPLVVTSVLLQSFLAHKYNRH
tara:strand:+ start:2076 stop:2912 length:837 start_codon:yes stop_codon:yes gene_type:complete